jgi:hypothetical protein
MKTVLNRKGWMIFVALKCLEVLFVPVVVVLPYYVGLIPHLLRWYFFKRNIYLSFFESIEDPVVFVWLLGLLVGLCVFLFGYLVVEFVPRWIAWNKKLAQKIYNFLGAK